MEARMLVTCSRPLDRTAKPLRIYSRPISMKSSSVTRESSRSNKRSENMEKPPPRASPPRKDFFWLDLNQYADFRDIKEFAQLADQHFKDRYAEEIATVPKRVKN